MSTEGVKYDQGKIRYDLLPVLAIEETAKCLTFGANKYSDDNWKLVPNAERKYYAALQRHIAEYRKGNMIDEESGLSHLSHAMCCLIFLMEFMYEGGKLDSKQ